MQSSENMAERPIGVIDALRRGFDLINRNPWLLLLPIVVDLVLWRAPQLSVGELSARALTPALEQFGLAGQTAGDAQLWADAVRQTAQGYGSILALVVSALVGFPLLLARSLPGALAGSGPLLELPDVQTATVYGVLILPVLLLFASLWLALVARRYAAEGLHIGSVLRRAGWIWLNLGLYLIGLIVAWLLTSLVLTALLSALAALGVASGSAMSVLILLYAWLLIWVGVGLTFVPDAVALDGVNIARALWRSLNVVGRNLSGTLGLVLLTLLLGAGFARIWVLLSAYPWGVPISMLGNAYIGSGLAVASLFFYRGRYQRWQQIRSTMLGARSTDEVGTRKLD